MTIPRIAGIAKSDASYSSLLKHWVANVQLFCTSDKGKSITSDCRVDSKVKAGDRLIHCQELPDGAASMKKYWLLPGKRSSVIAVALTNECLGECQAKVFSAVKAGGSVVCRLQVPRGIMTGDSLGMVPDNAPEMYLLDKVPAIKVTVDVDRCKLEDTEDLLDRIFEDLDELQENFLLLSSELQDRLIEKVHVLSQSRTVWDEARAQYQEVKDGKQTPEEEAQYGPMHYSSATVCCQGGRNDCPDWSRVTCKDCLKSGPPKALLYAMKHGMSAKQYEEMKPTVVRRPGESQDQAEMEVIDRVVREEQRAEKRRMDEAEYVDHSDLEAAAEKYDELVKGKEDDPPALLYGEGLVSKMMKAELKETGASKALVDAFHDMKKAPRRVAKAFRESLKKKETRKMKMWTPVLFIDVDGTIRKGKKELGHFVNTAAQVEVFPGVAQLLKVYKRFGWRIVAIDNQGGVSMGHMTEEQLTENLAETLKQCGGSDIIDLMRYSPSFNHSGNDRIDNSWDRKPKPGLVYSALFELNNRHGNVERYSPHDCLVVGNAREDEHLASSLSIQYLEARIWRQQNLEGLGLHLSDMRDKLEDASDHDQDLTWL